MPNIPITHIAIKGIIDEGFKKYMKLVTQPSMIIEIIFRQILLLFIITTYINNNSDTNGNTTVSEYGMIIIGNNNNHTILIQVPISALLLS
ncbi:hypothetical protein SY111_15080 [Ligilactobacillus agilis]|uniref:Uncharacterized protein n=1 Tax=Ligilactobacillus agilis TaxID=1601 RepID=A0A6F9XUB8_9LACO|nr:hypothetical protein SY111_15080 [Ligilactobacillus agilis]